VSTRLREASRNINQTMPRRLFTVNRFVVRRRSIIIYSHRGSVVYRSLKSKRVTPVASLVLAAVQGNASELLLCLSPSGAVIVAGMSRTIRCAGTAD
jgi:hypothetical protein